MKSKIIGVATVLTLALGQALWAQGRGGGGQRGGTGGGQRPKTMGQPRGGQQGPRGQEMGRGDMQRQRIHATDQQRDQYRNCHQTANRVSTQARQMAQAAKGAGFNSEEFRRQHEQLRNEIRTMQQEHERFMQGLSDEQRAAMQDRVRKMDQARERVNTRVQAMDQELDQGNADRKRLAEHARETERAMNEWQKQYRKMGSDMAIEQ